MPTGHPLTPAQRKSIASEDKLRLLMFQTAHQRLYLSEPNLTLRFLKALVYSSQPFTPRQREKMAGWQDRLKQMWKDTPRYANGAMRKGVADEDEPEPDGVGCTEDVGLRFDDERDEYPDNDI